MQVFKLLLPGQNKIPAATKKDGGLKKDAEYY